MSLSIEVIKFKDIIPFTRINRIVPELPPITLEIKGEDFRSVEKVVINDIVTEEFIIVNGQTLYVRLPPNSDTIRTLSIRSSGLTLTSEASFVEYALGTKTKSISGILKLVQLFVRWLLTSPGSDIYRPNDGGGLQDVVGGLIARGRVEPATASIVQAVARTEQQIRDVQSNLSSLALSERLLSAELTEFGLNEKIDAVSGKVLLTSMDGTNAISSITL